MGTNSYSIVSKRSVEKFYYPNEPSFLRAFVSKFKRRAPLINRGYWLRMKAIEEVVRQFLESKGEYVEIEPSSRKKKKIVVNLGCGEDTLPFRTLWQRQEQTRQNAEHGGQPNTNIQDDIVFVDIDYPELMMSKAALISKTSTFTDIIGRINLLSLGDSAKDPNAPRLLLRTPHYIAVGANLSDLDLLTPLLRSVLEDDSSWSPSDLEILFIAEVSITYMPTPAADAVIAWAHSVFLKSPSRFCLLEQFLPAGSSHPFAQTMLRHFEKSAALRSVEVYPTLESQRKRFLDQGWADVAVRSLWNLWQDDDFLDPAARKSLDDVELFDEWEEFALFAGHYFLLVASNRQLAQAPLPLSQSAETENQRTQPKLTLQCSRAPSRARRFATPARLDDTTIAHIGGFNTTGIASVGDYFTSSDSAAVILSNPRLPEAVACHTITAFHDQHILIGGRTSPAKASSNCWLLERSPSAPSHATEAWHWKPIATLEQGRYRHCAINVSIPTKGIDGILLFGGKGSDGQVLDDWSFWDATQDQWVEVNTETHTVPGFHNDAPDARPSARFSAVMWNDRPKSPELRLSGWLTGGINAKGVACEDLWWWTLRPTDAGAFVISFEDQSSCPWGWAATVYRFGATVVQSQFLDGVLLIGGVANSGVLQANEEILLINSYRSVAEYNVDGWEDSRPLLVGHSAVVADMALYGEILLLGGGAVCFSFGSCRNENLTALRLDSDSTLEGTKWKLVDHKISAESEAAQKGSHVYKGIPSVLGQSTSTPGAVADLIPPVRMIREISSAEFSDLLTSQNPTPVVLTSQDVGVCTSLWTPSYLTAHIGASRKVVIHSAETASLDFRSKNFSYATIPFEDFVQGARRGEHVYMRALAVGDPARRPANLEKDFPEIGADFHVPDGVNHVLNEGESGRAHSSVLRIAGDIEMWLHYDVMANVLCQARGKKRVVLFPPSDVLKLDFKAGDTTSSVDVFGPNGVLRNWKERGLQPQEVVLQKGDVLFIPACWLHATAPGGASDNEGDDGDGKMNVAVNVFFRSLEKGYAAGKDVYGNRDLQAYENARKDIEKIKSLLPTVNDTEKEPTATLLANILIGKGSTEQNKSMTRVKEVDSMRRKLATLPEQLKLFYAERLAVELIEVLKAE
ncbi:LCM-domain-containing protein [Rhizodiscina lignyota]|uniref:tRNA wybutosine-synthesizing protein 4 n=1 Tax=Rhizodiscina lignyota TaxID=1504668 RepID=A0A9P4INS2_9PEZI|nr:LCM-domain-containing protein [Rhizodiscina lignyota]